MKKFTLFLLVILFASCVNTKYELTYSIDGKDVTKTINTCERFTYPGSDAKPEIRVRPIVISDSTIFIYTLRINDFDGSGEIDNSFNPITIKKFKYLGFSK